MPCCALAAVLVGQILLALGAFRARVLGRPASGPEANPAVEWRLPPAGAATAALPAPRWRLARPGLALAVALEVILVFGAVYGIVTHLDHDAASREGRGAAHVHPAH